MDKISVLLIEPGKFPKVVEIENTLKAKQKLVGGYIEMYMPFEDDVAIICNEEGKFNGSKLNRAVYSSEGELLDIIAGTFFICLAPLDEDEEDFCSLSDDLMEKYSRIFKHPELFVSYNGNLTIIEQDEEF